MDKRYQPSQTETKIYQFWEKGGWFTPKIDKKKKPFCIVMPPPNANGHLHIGHALFITLQDLMSRYRRMKGRSVLWLPGADHAGILTQVVFERELAKKGKTRYDLGRESFYKACFAFSQKNKKTMYNQLRALGSSCDWTREQFTLDKKVTKVVYETFFQLYKDGLVYRAQRLISWCPRCATALSDLEVDHKEKDSRLWHIKYPLKGGGAVIVATTRPETMLGDTAVAVNPRDKRYKDIVGKVAILPLVKRAIPVIADKMVDQAFGSGAVKITPAHDHDDFAVGQRHKLELIPVIGFDGRITQEVGKNFAGLTRVEARKEVLSRLKEQGLLVKEEKHANRVGSCERCGSTIEILPSQQWFIKMKSLAKGAIQAVKKGETKIIPRYFKKTYFHRLDNIQDWCISRQLWWGHQLPIWYCGTKGFSSLQLMMNPGLKNSKDKEEGCGKIFVGHQPPQKCSCGEKKFIRDPDTFDTWFSSAQWPYSTLGYPDDPDYRRFYPTSVMETGYEILLIWVTRMMMMGIYRTGKVPFKDVYLHGMVRDVFGKVMSKSRPETSVDPTETITKYGTDALRMALVYGTSAGKDLVVEEKKVESMRNFTNKIWNAARFVYLIAENENWQVDLSARREGKDDKEIKRQFNELTETVTNDLEKYRFGQGLEKIYQFFWHQFCDVYLEQVKDRRSEALPTLMEVLTSSLKLLHPFAPFVTETVYQSFKKRFDSKKGLFASPSLMIAPWPSGF